jgi:uncharacterized YigZ family protein
MDHYQTPAARTSATIKIERSEFIGIVLPVATDDAFFAALTAIQKELFDATHHCWAFRLFDGGTFRTRSADAGEPSGTAGKPILGAIEAAGLYDAAVVVVRYYGGIKLGTGGLARAYREAAATALTATPRLDRYLYSRFVVTVPFEMLNVVYRLVAPPDVTLIGETYGDTNEFTFDVRTSMAEAFGKALGEKRLRWRQ